MAKLNGSGHHCRARSQTVCPIKMDHLILGTGAHRLYNIKASPLLPSQVPTLDVEACRPVESTLAAKARCHCRWPVSRRVRYT